ncbi:Uncharacterised protein [Mycobacteroides abscessus subsp. bolletii]|nr:Uncharacterised protein [Mycobacteroides abscessus subsp. bolletii]SHT34114.1 Uncharacterised protein [Mycobacteroides abscessus subsp. bolletii]SHT52276.1 Uncharacterised protein [Mycobacteroides abscessus subsp. bolletii]SKG65678.1 Uncharacterised protein [Mycobacteroides abscessus subsp. bolletii]SKH20691.1 Uncharacterised protein [Mycobacteroides abscessus subsp. bolletii]
MWEIAAPVPRKSLMTGPAARGEKPTATRKQPIGPILVDCDQLEARAKRSAGWLREVHYLAFDACTEVSDLCRPLADEIQSLRADGIRLADMRDCSIYLRGDIPLPEPIRDVRSIAKAVHGLRGALVTALAAILPSMLPDGGKDRLAAVVRDVAHSAVPEVSEDDLDSGAWVDVLVAHVEPVSADLAAVVAAQPRGVVSALDVAVSEALSRADGRGLAQEVGMLAGRFPELRARRDKALEGRAWAAAQAQHQEQQRVERALRELRLS